jgi:hypothetical protein
LWIAFVTWKNGSSPLMMRQSATSPWSFSSGTTERSSSDTPPP